MDITASAQWSELAKVYEDKKDLNLRELFSADADRARNFTFDAAGLHVDLSKNLIDGDIVKQLVEVAKAADLEARRALHERFMLSQSVYQTDPWAELAERPAEWAPVADLTLRAAE